MSLVKPAKWALASEMVKRAVLAGYSPVGYGLAAVRIFDFQRRSSEPPGTVVLLVAGERRIELYLSPRGRSIRIYVDGKEIQP